VKETPFIAAVAAAVTHLINCHAIDPLSCQHLLTGQLRNHQRHTQHHNLLLLLLLLLLLSPNYNAAAFATHTLSIVTPLTHSVVSTC
jgi:hypothetical protein